MNVRLERGSFYFWSQQGEHGRDGQQRKAWVGGAAGVGRRAEGGQQGQEGRSTYAEGEQR